MAPTQFEGLSDHIRSLFFASSIMPLKVGSVQNSKGWALPFSPGNEQLELQAEAELQNGIKCVVPLNSKNSREGKAETC